MERKKCKCGNEKCTHPLTFLLDKNFGASASNVYFAGFVITYIVYCYTCRKTMEICIVPAESQTKQIHRVWGKGKHRLVEINKLWFLNLALTERLICVDTYSDVVGEDCVDYDDLYVKILQDLNF